jgi:hypothetical protein
MLAIPAMTDSIDQFGVSRKRPVDFFRSLFIGFLDASSDCLAQLHSRQT